MHAHTFTDYARDRLSVAFPEWLEWLASVYASKERRAAAVESYGLRFGSMTVDELERVVCLVLAGKRQRPEPRLLIETLANYAERIQQDAAKRQRAATERQQGMTARQAMQGTPDEWDWRDRFAAAKHFAQIARAGGTPEVPCYEPENWQVLQACIRRLMDSAGLADADIGRDEYARRLEVAGIVREEAGDVVQRVPDGETWDAAEVCEQLEAIRCDE